MTFIEFVFYFVLFAFAFILVVFAVARIAEDSSDD